MLWEQENLGLASSFFWDEVIYSLSQIIGNGGCMRRGLARGTGAVVLT